MKIELSEIPITAAKTQNRICAMAGRMRWMPKLSTKTNASGESMTAHFSGVRKARAERA